jgi:predicted secreted protein
MTAQVGRAVLLQILVGTEYTTIAALISKSLTLNKEPVDITSDDDAGWRTLLEDIDGTKSVDIACEGILKTNQVGLPAFAAMTARFVVRHSRSAQRLRRA